MSLEPKGKTEDGKLQLGSRMFRTLDCAIAYADLGWPVVPLWSVNADGKCQCGRPDCSSPGKHPHSILASKGSRSATLNGTKIASWGTVCKAMNVGICTGRESGIVVLDVDPAHGGNESLAKIEDAHGKIETLEVITGGGGRHLYFKYPEGERLRNSVGKLGPGLDVRSDGGFVVAPPSLHASGEEYRWRVDPRGIDPAECPKWFLDEHRVEPVQAQGSPRYDAEMIEAGERNSTLTSMAGAMRRKGFERDAIVAALLETNRRRCKPLLTDTEVDQIAASVAKYQPENSSGKKKDDQSDDRKSQATMLIELADGLELFHSPDCNAFATISEHGHRQTYRICSKAFRHWLTGQFWRHHRKAPGSQGMQDALGVLTSKAVYEGDEYEVCVRVGKLDGDIWLDLGDAQWRGVRISADGWEVCSEPAVKFLRPRGLLQLPVPEHGGNVGLLRQFLNLENDHDWVLVLSWLVAALRPTGPYPMLVVNGEQGSAKTTLCRVLRTLIDPNKAALRAVPRDVRDLMIAAANSWVLGYDNLSGIAPWLSDAFCRLATGGGFATRELYSDNEEVLIDVQRPVIINGIEELATRSDLLDRCIGLTLPTIPDSKRRTEKELWRDIWELRPLILGAILDGVSGAIRNLPSVVLRDPPRMADFAAWSVAAETSLDFRPGAFMDAYSDNRESANSLAIEASAVGSVLQEFMSGRSHWRGTAQELLTALNSQSSAGQVNTRRDWPKTPQALGKKLRRLAPNLRRRRLDVGFGRSDDKARNRVISLEWLEHQPSDVSEPS